MTTVPVSDIGKRVLTLVPLKANGQPGKVDTADEQPSASLVSDDDGEEGAGTASVTVNEDGSLKVECVSGTIAEGKTVRTTVVRVSADADLDEGETRQITHDVVIVTTRAEAQSFGEVSIGDEEPK